MIAVFSFVASCPAEIQRRLKNKYTEKRPQIFLNKRRKIHTLLSTLGAGTTHVQKPDLCKASVPYQQQQCNIKAARWCMPFELLKISAGTSFSKLFHTKKKREGGATL